MTRALWRLTTPLRRTLALCVPALYSLVVAAAIIVLSGSPYDFMIGEDDDGHTMTACDLPTPSDDVSGFYAMVTCVLVLVLLITGLVRLVRDRRLAPSMVLGVGLLALWAYKFFAPTLGCARVPAQAMLRLVNVFDGTSSRGLLKTRSDIAGRYATVHCGFGRLASDHSWPPTG